MSRHLLRPGGSSRDGQVRVSDVAEADLRDGDVLLVDGVRDEQAIAHRDPMV